jgi:anti-sigma regulatory factor (Ser/Thr protein kinase)
VSVAERQQWSAQAHPAAVPQLRHIAAEFAASLAGFRGTALDDVRACISEAVTNAVVHAFRDGRPVGNVRLVGTWDDVELVFVVSDDGIGFGPRADSPGLGLGIPTIAALADTMTVDTTMGGGTRLCMAFSRAGAPVVAG